MKKILAIMLSLAATASLMMLSVSAESLEVVEASLPPVDPSQTYEVIIIPEETTTPVVTTAIKKAEPVVTTTVAETKPVVITTVATTKPATKPVSKPELTQKEVKQVAEASVVPSIALNILDLIK